MTVFVVGETAGKTSLAGIWPLAKFTTTACTAKGPTPTRASTNATAEALNVRIVKVPLRFLPFSRATATFSLRRRGSRAASDGGNQLSRSILSPLSTPETRGLGNRV